MADDLHTFLPDANPSAHLFPRPRPPSAPPRITRFSFAKQPDKGTLKPIDFTKGTADPGFRDVAELFGLRYAWRACIAACETKLRDDLSLKHRTAIEISLLNAQAQLKLAPADTPAQRRRRKGK